MEPAGKPGKTPRVEQPPCVELADSEKMDVDEVLNLRVDQQGRPLPSLRQFADIVSSAALENGFFGIVKKAVVHPESVLLRTQLRALRDLRLQEARPILKHVYSVAASIIHRQIAREKFAKQCDILIENGSVVKPFRRASWGGMPHTENKEMLVGTEACNHHAVQYYSMLYSATPGGASLPRWLWKRWSWHDLSCLPQISGYRVRRLAMSMKKHKTYSRQDLLVAEMLHNSPDEVFEILAQCFALRLMNAACCEGDDIWDSH